MSKPFEPILVPYCKFQNGYPPKWTYYNISGHREFLSPGFIYGYCSIFRDKYAIYGQYHYHSRDKNLVFGVINKKMESVENAIYSFLQFYPGTSNCFIGRLNTNQSVEKESPSHQVFFNINNHFWTTGFDIIPISNNLFIVNNLNQEIKIVSTEGIQIFRLPFFVNKQGKEVEGSRNSLEFHKAIIYRSEGFSLRYYKLENNSFYADEDENEIVDSFNEKVYYFDFDITGNLLHQGKKTSFNESIGNI